MQNYFNYFTEIEEHFQRRRGSLLLLSTLDWALIESWREAGIPLEAVLGGIDSAFDKYESRKQRSNARRVNGLAWCAQAVIEAAEQQREAATGARPAASSDASPHASSDAERAQGFESERVAAHLREAAAALLASIAQSIDASMAPTKAARAIAQPLCQATAEKLTALAAEIECNALQSNALQGNASSALEDLERQLTVMEEKLLNAVAAEAPDDLLVAIKAEAQQALAAYRSRMQPAQRKLIERQYEQKRLLEHYRLPRLSLFYMRQT